MEEVAGKLIKSYLMFTFKRRNEDTIYMYKDSNRVMDFLQMIKRARVLQGERK